MNQKSSNRRSVLSIAIFLALAFLIAWPRIQEMMISWDEAAAVEFCGEAVAGLKSWPKTDKHKCRAMHMCAEKANLSQEEIKKLRESVARIENCGALN